MDQEGRCFPLPIVSFDTTRGVLLIIMTKKVILKITFFIIGIGRLSKNYRELHNKHPSRIYVQQAHQASSDNHPMSPTGSRHRCTVA